MHIWCIFCYANILWIFRNDYVVTRKNITPLPQLKITKSQLAILCISISNKCMKFHVKVVANKMAKTPLGYLFIPHSVHRLATHYKGHMMKNSEPHAARWVTYLHIETWFAAWQTYNTVTNKWWISLTCLGILTTIITVTYSHISPLHANTQ